ncbi:MAG: hypothetical protein OSA95_09465, partial [Opitutales bacterium]|nr:hypothetical protein [Opitutales bacterium]
DANHKENGRVDQTADGGHQAVGADAALKAFAGGTDEGKSGHRGAEHAHQQEERAYGVAGYEEVLAGAPGQFVGEHPKPKK